MATEQIQISRKFCLDKLTLDPDVQISETSEYLTVDPVTLIREGVYPYEDGMVLKPGDELAKGAAVSRLYVAWDHPPLRIITQPQEIKGTVDGLRSEKDSKGMKIKGTLTFIKNRLTTDQVELIRSKIRRDVSLGFYFTIDRTPGSWNGQHYDYVQRNYVFDHVASVDHGRCPFPRCGIGVDADALNVQAGIGANMRIGNDPYPNEHSCRIRDPGAFQANSFRRITSGKAELILARLKGESKMTVQAIRYPKASWSEATARSHCAGHKGSFEPASSGDSDTVMTKEKGDTSGQEKFSPLEVNLRPADETSDANCQTCIFYNFYVKNNCTIVEGSISGNMTCDEQAGRPTLERWVLGVKRGNASEPSETSADQLTAEQKSQIPRSRWGYTPSDNRAEWKLPMPDRAHIVAALQALQGSRGGVDIPASALAGVKRKVCSLAKSEGVKSEYCGTADANDAVPLLRRISNMPLPDLVNLHRRIDRADDFREDGLLHTAVTLALKKARRKR